MEYIESIDLDIELESNQTDVSKQIVGLLGNDFFFRISAKQVGHVLISFLLKQIGHVDIPRDVTSINGFKENIKKVQQFLEILKNKYENEDEFVVICLKELYKIIMTIGKIYSYDCYMHDNTIY